MGLDIVAYRGIRATDVPVAHNGDGTVDDRLDEGLLALDREVSDAWDAEHMRRYGTRPGYFDGLDSEHYYTYDEEAVFFSTAYSTYGEFRDLLHDYADSLGEEGCGLFRAVIRFSDCEGTFGPDLCGRLLVDFEKHEGSFRDWADRVLDEDSWVDPGYAFALYESYEDGLRMAADGGCLVYG